MTVDFENKSEVGFKKAYNYFPLKLRKEIKEKIMNECFWNSGMFYANIKGKHSLRPFEREKIEEIFAGYNINAWTGESINK